MHEDIARELLDQLIDYTLDDDRSSFEEAVALEYLEDDMEWDESLLDRALADPNFEHIYKTAYLLKNM